MIALATKISSIISNVITWLLIFLWVYAAVSKLIDYQTFVVQLAQSPLLNPINKVVAWLVPLCEVATAIILMFPRFRMTGLYVSFGLMVMFVGYIFVITRYSDSVPCSCGGILEKFTWSQHLLFNTVFVLLTFTAIMLHPNDILLQQIRTNRKPV